MPDWVKQTIDQWLNVAQITHGRVFRCVCRRGVVWGTKITEKVVWHVVKEYAEKLGISKLAPHDLRRSCALLAHLSVGLDSWRNSSNSYMIEIVSVHGLCSFPEICA